jgi:hypothetical protein
MAGNKYGKNRAHNQKNSEWKNNVFGGKQQNKVESHL